MQSILVYVINFLLSIILSFFMVPSCVNVSYSKVDTVDPGIQDIFPDFDDDDEEKEEIPEYDVFTSDHFTIDSRMIQYMYRSTSGIYVSSGAGYSSADKDITDYDFFFVKNNNNFSLDGSGQILFLNYEKVEKEARCILAYCELAYQYGIELNFYDNDLIENDIEYIETLARNAGYDEDKFISMLYGEGVEEDDIEELRKLSALAQKAYNYFRNEYYDSISYYEADNFFLENMVKYESYGFYQMRREIGFFFISSELFGGDTWSTWNCAETLRSIFVNNDMNTATFTDVADDSFGHTLEYWTCYSSSQGIGITEIDEWLNDDYRCIDDTDIIETAHGCYVVWMIDKDIDYWNTDILDAYSEVKMEEDTFNLLNHTYINDNGFERFKSSQNVFVTIVPSVNK